MDSPEGYEPKPPKLDKKAEQQAIAKVAYEHLFPGQNWEELPERADSDFKFPIDSIRLRAEYFPHALLRPQEGFASLVRMNPTKERTRLELAEVQPTDKNIKRIEFDDLIDPDETIAGVGTVFLGSREIEESSRREYPQYYGDQKDIYSRRSRQKYQQAKRTHILC